ADILAEEKQAARLLAGLYRVVPTIRHSRVTMPAMPEELDRAELSCPALNKRKQRDGRVQFATLGRGNHFLEFQADEEGSLWLMNHSGSRALGQAITEHHLTMARQANTGLPFLDADSPEGQAYLADLECAYCYAQQSRSTIIETVSKLMQE